MRHLTLSGRRQRARVYIGYRPVEVPFDITYIIALKQPGYRFIEILDDLSSRHVEHELIARHHRGAPRSRQRPVGMSAVKIRVLAHHLRLDPQTEVQPHCLYLSDQALKTSRQLVPVRDPVSESCVVVVSVSEPSVVQDEQLSPDLRSLAGDDQEFFFSEAEICRFPVVHKHRAVAVSEASAHDVVPYHAVEPVGKLRQSLCAAEYHLGSVERFARS